MPCAAHCRVGGRVRAVLHNVGAENRAKTPYISSVKIELARSLR
ncbi:hypothetical protein SAMN05216227_100183 [Pseudorhodobacter antarcticus]|uniref:Uncharacterized protein n=1 Tax=Pseudorhodobacter antarcticus TaxID=1077947 RepID=A0A1H8AD19_9RHOB|nr:hypothetical protein SAMN05216227_100183 [Pseudorhodobacter antarcticus]